MANLNYKFSSCIPVDRICRDLKRIGQIGTISFTEINLFTWFDPSPRLIDYINGTSGYHRLRNCVLIDYNQITMDCIDLLLEIICHDSCGIDVIKEILVWMYKKHKKEIYYLNIEISPKGDLPNITEFSGDRMIFDF